MQVDVSVIRLRRRRFAQTNKQVPKIYNGFDQLLPPLRVLLQAMDVAFTHRLGYSPWLAFKSRLSRWIYDTDIREAAVCSPFKKKGIIPPCGTVAQERNVGRSRVIVEEGDDREYTGLAFDLVSSRATVEKFATLHGAGKLFEEFFHVEMNVRSYQNCIARTQAYD